MRVRVRARDQTRHLPGEVERLRVSVRVRVRARDQTRHLPRRLLVAAAAVRIEEGSYLLGVDQPAQPTAR